jgi:4-methylaminobutanoate oxidase (formaldehyde-forming)
MARTVGIEMHEISLREAEEMWPLLNTDDLVGAAYIPGDGHTSPVDTTMALAKGARDRGVSIVEGVAVTSIRVENERVVGVETEHGYVEAETVVLAGGIWTRHLAQTAGVNVPLQACEHFYVVTEPIAGVVPDMPVLRDPTNYTYFKEETGKIMAGFFEPRGKVWNLDGIPRDFSFGTLPEDWAHVGPVFERSIRYRQLARQVFSSSSTDRKRSPPTASITLVKLRRSKVCSWRPGSTRWVSNQPAEWAGYLPIG